MGLRCKLQDLMFLKKTKQRLHITNQTVDGTPRQHSWSQASPRTAPKSFQMWPQSSRVEGSLLLQTQPEQGTWLVGHRKGQAKPSWVSWTLPKAFLMTDSTCTTAFFAVKYNCYTKPKNTYKELHQFLLICVSIFLQFLVREETVLRS